MKVAVVGHTEWIEFGRVDHVPAAGDIVHAREWWEEPGGGGAIAAVQLAKLAGACTFLTALGDDDLGRRSRRELESLGVGVEAAIRGAPTRRAVTFIDPAGERTITTLGERLDPHAEDPLAWDELAEADAVYFTAGDPDALREARRARVLVATTRAFPTLVAGGVLLDAAVGSGHDPAERYNPSALTRGATIVVRTEGVRGGTYETSSDAGRYEAAPLPGPVVDTYGCGDSFAAGLTFALGEGRDLERALGLAARCGAASVTGRGPFGGQLTRADI